MAEPAYDERARELLAEYERRFGPMGIPVQAGLLAEDLLGLLVRWDDIPYSGMLVPERREIILSRTEARYRGRRWRFTLGHEIGHWVHHCRPGQSARILCREVESMDSAESVLEREADAFAQELLMPEEPLLAYHRPGTSIEKTAKRFDVSPQAMHWRLYTFGLAPPPPPRRRGSGLRYRGSGPR